ncbi:MAG TPA: hypothetical protein V6C99_06480 [Oculatellaceae cyanobacterium]|jgi:hypothetical protein
MLKRGKALLAVAGLVAAVVPSIAFSEEAPFATYNIRLESTSVQTKAEPVVSSPITKGVVAFRIENNTGKAVYFVNGNQKQYIPVVSNSTVIAPYSQEAYRVVDNQGQLVAEWTLDAAASQQSVAASASQAQFERWGEQIQQVLEASRNRTVSFEQESKPAAAVMYTKTAKPAVSRNTVIRGYW